MTDRTSSWSESGGRLHFDAFQVAEDLGRGVDALDLEPRRNLVRSLVRVVVRPGRGAERLTVDPVSG